MRTATRVALALVVFAVLSAAVGQFSSAEAEAQAIGSEAVRSALQDDRAWRVAAVDPLPDTWPGVGSQRSYNVRPTSGHRPPEADPIGLGDSEPRMRKEHR